MKLWRKKAKKEFNSEVGGIVRNGRRIKYAMQMEEMLFKKATKTYPLLDTLFSKGDIQFVLTKAQKQGLADAMAQAPAVEEANEAQ